MNNFASVAGFGVPEITIIAGSIVIIVGIISVLAILKKGFLKGYRNEK
jgi:hypothetical protein